MWDLVDLGWLTAHLIAVNVRSHGIIPGLSSLETEIWPHRMQVRFALIHAIRLKYKLTNVVSCLQGLLVMLLALLDCDWFAQNGCSGLVEASEDVNEQFKATVCACAEEKVLELDLS